MTIGWKKVGVLAVVAGVLLVLAAVRPGTDSNVAEADLASPGGIAALPSAAPGIPGIANQAFPAVIGTGQSAIVAVWCDPLGTAPITLWCPDPDGSSLIGSGSVQIKLTQLYPTAGGTPKASIGVTGSSSAVIADNAGADDDAGIGVIAFQVNASAATQAGTQGVNEIVEVRACDETGAASGWENGDCRTVQIVVVDSTAAWGPTGPTSTATQEQPIFVSHRCSVNGRAPLGGTTAEGLMEASNISVSEAGGDGQQGLDDMYDLLFGPNLLFGVPGLGFGSNNLATLFDLDIADIWCGGNTGGLYDDSVSFTTDKNIFDIRPIAADVESAAQQAVLAGWFFPPGVDSSCASGKNINVQDNNALAAWWSFLTAPWSGEAGCDLDGWRNGVVTTEMLGIGEVGVATITVQQGGGIGTVEELNVTYAGAGGVSLFLGLTGTDTIGLLGGDFTVVLTDANLVPVGDESVECTISPAAAGLAVIPANGTTGSIISANPGQVTMSVMPTGISVVGGQDITLTCVLVSNRDVSASATISLSTTPETELVDLVDGCQIVTATEDLTTTVLRDRFDPAYDSAWLLDAGTGMWMGDSPAAGAAMAGPNDLAGVDRLEGFFACMPAGGGTFERAII